MVCRRSQARVRRHHPRPRARQAYFGAQTARWRVRRDYAVELPQRHDHAQSRARAGCRLHLRHPPCLANAVFCAGHCRLGRTCRHSGGRVQRDHRLVARNRPRVHRKRYGEKIQLHRLHRRRPPAAGAMRLHHQENLNGAGRQRAVYRVRRCRPRCRRLRRDCLQIPQRRANLRVRQPHLCAKRRV